MTAIDATEGKHVNDRRPNFYDDSGRFYLVRCYECEPNRGRENWAMAVYDGRCAWCSWNREHIEEPKK